MRALANLIANSQGENLPPDVIEDGVKTYFSCFHAQPYTLLCQSSIGASHSIHSVVLNPMLALAIRCSSHSYWKDPLLVRKWIHNLTEKSWQELLLMYGEGNTSLKYLQGLCLLAQVDFSGKELNLLQIIFSMLTPYFPRWTGTPSAYPTVPRYQDRAILRVSDRAWARRSGTR